MPSLASWERGKRSYEIAMAERFDATQTTYGFEMVRNIYGVTHRLEMALDNPDGIEPLEIDRLLGQMEDQLQQFREWQLIKNRTEVG